jgi:beta-phosphoglucomutase-like phosphatase (HAD superfamily)
LLGLRWLELQPHQCLVVEDSPRGLQSALAADIRCIVLRNSMTRHHHFEGAYRIVDSMDELLGEVEALM